MSATRTLGVKTGTLPTDDLVAIATTKTARAANAREFWLRDYADDALAAFDAAREIQPRAALYGLFRRPNGYSFYTYTSPLVVVERAE